MSTVLLQRDASLSRRVYAWFLGTADSSTDQVDYFRKHGLETVVTVLLADFATDDRSAFRIFLTMLDKAEIASALSPRLVMPALEALRAGEDDETLTTATAIYEAVEPAFIWSQLSDMVAQGVSLIGAS